MRYLVCGATSATGNKVIQVLAEKVGPERITCLVRPTAKTEPLRAMGLRLQQGDVTEPESFQGLLNAGTCYVDMTHPKHYHKSLEAAVKAGVERAYFITTTGIFSRYNQFAEIYKTNEARIRASGIVYTILRPSMIYGSSRDKNMHRLILFLRRYPVFPLFGAGRSLMQPVFVDDLAAGIVRAIGDARTENQEYNLAGPRGIPYREIVETILKLLKRRVALLGINVRLAAAIARVAARVPGFPVTHEQVLRLLEDKVFDISKARQELGYQPREFAEGIEVEIAGMRAEGVLR